MKLRYRISIWVALALAGSLLWGGSVWLWLAGICAGKFLFRLLLTIVLAIAVYILTYALIIGATGKSSVSCPLKPSDSAPLKHSTMPP